MNGLLTGACFSQDAGYGRRALHEAGAVRKASKLLLEAERTAWEHLDKTVKCQIPLGVLLSRTKTLRADLCQLKDKPKNKPHYFFSVFKSGWGQSGCVYTCFYVHLKLMRISLQGDLGTQLHAPALIHNEMYGLTQS